VTIKLRVRDSLSVGVCRPVHVEFTATVEDAANGWVSVDLPTTLTRQPGIYIGEFAAVATDTSNPNRPVDAVLFSNVFYLNIERGAWSKQRAKGPPTLAEVRLHLRDSAGVESYLLDTVRWDDAEIAMAAERAVAYWNEVPPPIRTYSTRNFPFWFHWLDAIAGYLFLMAAEQYRANNLQYSAAGISVNDQDKEMPYEGAAKRRLDDWKRFVRDKKVQLNLDQCWGGLSSPYSRGW
jgi:hypothetical protein